MLAWVQGMLIIITIVFITIFIVTIIVEKKTLESVEMQFY